MERRSLPPFEDDFARALLRSAEHDEPSQAAYAKAATALGVGVGLGVGASIPAAAAGAASLAGAGRWSSSLAAKAGAFVVSGALLVASGAALVRAGSSAPKAEPQGHAVELAAQASPGQPVPSPSVAPRAAAPSNADGSPPSDATAALGTAAPAHDTNLPSVVTRPKQRARLRARASAETTASATSSLGEQVRSLDRARVALASGSATGALLEIGRYRKAYPSGVFLTEASVIEIEALAARGDRSRAASRASAFVAAHPDSPQAERLRSLIPSKIP